MIAEEKKVYLSKQQVSYLEMSGILADTFPEKLQDVSTDPGQARVFRIPLDKAEEIRSVLTEHLAKVGFDAEYRTTDEGSILEELIDKFYFR